MTYYMIHSHFVQLDTPLEDIYNVSREEIEHSVVTKEVMDAFYEKHAVLRKLKKVAVDHIVGHISLVYELVYPRSIEIMKKQGYLERLMAFESKEEEFTAFIDEKDNKILAKREDDSTKYYIDTTELKNPWGKVCIIVYDRILDRVVGFESYDPASDTLIKFE